MAFTYHTVLFCLLMGWNSMLMGQIQTTDSLERALTTTTDTARVDLLNRLTYEFITNDNDKAARYNSEALELSRQIGYVRGEAISYTYRGVYEYLTGYFPEAHRDFHKGLALSRQQGDTANVGYIFLQLGNCSLEEVETDSALLYLNKAFAVYRGSSDSVTLSKIYRNMSAAYGQRFQYETQQLYLDSAIAIRQLLPDKALLVEAMALQANNALRKNDLEAAEKIIAETEKVARDYQGFEENRYDLLHYRALILFKKDSVEKGMLFADSAKKYFLSVSLARKYVTLMMDVGISFSLRGEYELALDNLYSALEVSKLHGFDSETYLIRSNIGWVNYNLGDYRHALNLANEALGSKTKRLLKSDFANALLLKGISLRELDELDLAAISLDSAHTIFLEAGNPLGRTDALMSLGSLSAKQKQYDEALAFFHESLALATENGYTYGLARSSWGLGNVYFKQGNFGASLKYLNDSEQYAQRAHASPILIMGYNTRRDLLAAQGRFEESLKYSMKASQLKDSLNRSDLIRRFANLEKMHEIEQRDRSIRELQQEKIIAENQLSLQNAQLQQQFILLVTGLFGLILAVVIAFAYYRVYRRIMSLNTTITEKNERIQLQADNLQEVNNKLKQLYQEVSKQNQEIHAKSKELADTNKRIGDLNQNLERIVEEKTHELRTTNEQLVKYNSELLQFSYTVSHNLRGPVARLLGLMDLAQAEQDLEKTRQWINLMNNTAKDLDLIISDLSKLLDFRNGHKQFRESIDLQQEWERSISLLSESLTGDETIVGDFKALPEVVTVRAMVQSVFYNLLSNAVKYRSKKRNLTVIATSHQADGKAIIEIKDNGLGIDTELHKEQLFKLYKRFHTNVEGRGIGLYLIKVQLEVLNGTIEVESKDGQGSLFRVSIPLTTIDELAGMNIGTSDFSEE